MIKVNASADINSKAPIKQAQPAKLNASEPPSDINSVLTSSLDRLRDISTQLAGIITDQVENPDYQDGKAVLADRVIDWTADIFAISEDIRFYLNPPEKTKED